MWVMTSVNLVGHKCSCGHRGDRMNTDHADVGFQAGHGQCNKCDCSWYTWTPE